jgi:transcriptional regulator with XRE-family HTH domain
MIQMEVGERIRLRREELNMTQEDLAKKVGYTSRSSVAKVESNANGMVQSKLVAFANALETTPAYLLGWEEKAETEKKNDAIADIILKLRTDNDYLEVVQALRDLTPEQYVAVKTFLSAFKK